MAKEGKGVAGATRSSQDLTGKLAKSAGTSNEDWVEMDLKAACTIQLCLANEVMYNVMDEGTITGF